MSEGQCERLQHSHSDDCEASTGSLRSKHLLGRRSTERRVAGVGCQPGLGSLRQCKDGGTSEGWEQKGREHMPGQQSSCLFHHLLAAFVCFFSLYLHEPCEHSSINQKDSLLLWWHASATTYARSMSLTRCGMITRQGLESLSRRSHFGNCPNRQVCLCIYVFVALFSRQTAESERPH